MSEWRAPPLPRRFRAHTVGGGLAVRLLRERQTQSAWSASLRKAGVFRGLFAKSEPRGGEILAKGQGTGWMFRFEWEVAFRPGLVSCSYSRWEP